MTKARPNLTLAKLVTESYLESADTMTDLIYFTVEAYEKLDKVREALYPHMTDDELMATREVVNHHLYAELTRRYGV